MNRLFLYFDGNERLTLPMSRIVKFAVATALRLDEICRIEWTDLEIISRMLVVRDRKDPRHKTGNSQRTPLFEATGYDAWGLALAQAKHLGHTDARIFPYNSRSVGTAFRRACRKLGIKDLHFHDLRHEGTSRLFEAGFSIEQVALVTGHRDWKMLRRYTHIQPESLHRIASSPAINPIQEFSGGVREKQSLAAVAVTDLQDEIVARRPPVIDINYDSG